MGGLINFCTVLWLLSEYCIQVLQNLFLYIIGSNDVMLVNGLSNLT